MQTEVMKTAYVAQKREREKENFKILNIVFISVYKSECLNRSSWLAKVTKHCTAGLNG